MPLAPPPGPPPRPSSTRTPRYMCPLLVSARPGECPDWARATGEGRSTETLRPHPCWPPQARAVPVHSGHNGHREGALHIWQVGGGHDPVGASSQQAQPAHLLGIAVWHAAQQRLLEQQGPHVPSLTTLWDLAGTRVSLGGLGWGGTVCSSSAQQGGMVCCSVSSQPAVCPGLKVLMPSSPHLRRKPRPLHHPQLLTKAKLPLPEGDHGARPCPRVLMAPGLVLWPKILGL